MKHDAVGNMIYDGRYIYTYDAWNRMVAVNKAYNDGPTTDGDGDTINADPEKGALIATMVYDGLGRRVSKAVENSGDLDCTYHYYYSGHSLVEEHDGSQNVLKQYVWGRMYIDELVQIGVNDDPEAGDEDDVESFYYALHNANFNVAALTDDDGVIVERYEYDPYGQRQVFISTGDNDPHAHGAVAMSQRVVIGSVTQAYGLNPFGHQGKMHDEAIGVMYYNARMYHLRLGCFGTTDLLNQELPGGGYHDGMNRYQYVRSNPPNRIDPSGLFSEFIDCTCCQEEALEADEERAQQLIEDLKAEIEVAINNLPAHLVGSKALLSKASRYLDRAANKLRSGKVKCDGTAPAAFASAWPFGNTATVYAPYWRTVEKFQAATLVHEGTHMGSGTTDAKYFWHTQEYPHDVGGVDYPRIASTYDTWIMAGFCVPGLDCPKGPPPHYPPFARYRGTTECP